MKKEKGQLRKNQITTGFEIWQYGLITKAAEKVRIEKGKKTRSDASIVRKIVDWFLNNKNLEDL